jgi:hypothetical protein
LDQYHESITLEIDLLGEPQAFLWTGGYAEFTPLTNLLRNNDFASDHSEFAFRFLSWKVLTRTDFTPLFIAVSLTTNVPIR